MSIVGDRPDKGGESADADPASEDVEHGDESEQLLATVVYFFGDWLDTDCQP